MPANTVTFWIVGVTTKVETPLMKRRFGSILQPLPGVISKASSARRFSLSLQWRSVVLMRESHVTISLLLAFVCRHRS